MKLWNRNFLAICTVFVLSFSQAYGRSKTSSQKANVPVNSERITYPQEFYDLINTSLSSIQKKDYLQALTEYTNNQWMQNFFEGYRTDFSSKRNVTSIISSTASGLQNLQSFTMQYMELIPQAEEAVNQINTQIRKKDGAAVLEAVKESQQVFLALAQARNSLAAEEEKLRAAHSTYVSQGGNSQEVNYPLLALKYAAGLDGCYGSGILGVMDSFMDSKISSVTEAIKALVKEDEAKFTKAVTKNNLLTFPAAHDSAKESLNSMNQLCMAMSLFQSFHLEFNQIHPTTLFTEAAKLKAAYDFEQELSAQSLILLEGAGQFAQELHSSDSAQPPENPLEGLRTGTESFSTTLVQSAGILSTIGKTATAAKNLQWFTAYSSWDAKYQIWNDSRTTYLVICNELINSSTVNATKIWIRIANWFVEAGTAIVEENNLKFQDYQNYETTPQYIYKNIDSLTQAIQSDISILERCDAYLDEGYAFRSNFTQQRREFSSSIRELENLIYSCQDLKATALANHNTSMDAKAQVDLFYNRATASFNSGDYSSAHTNLDRANDTYGSVIESLRLDSEVQEECYTRLQELRQEFIEREKPILVNEVRRYKNEAKTNYYAGEFDQANALLTRAETRRSEWAKLMDTTLDPDDELQRLKEMVNTALSIKEGRIIYPEDPLYPEMSQLLSIANMYYQQAMTESKKGNREQSSQLLEKSKEKLNELKLVYPRNQEASILSLRIDKLLDPQAFDAMFAEKISALKRVNYKQKDLLALESYNDLMDLYQINPNYSGLKTYINSVEIDLGIRQKPVSAPDLSQAKTLANEAKAILDTAGRDEEKLNQARNKANEALKIDQNNSLAIQVLDEVALRSGGAAAVVLSAADEEKYQSAVRDLQSGAVFSAKQKIDELLQTPLNQRSAKILKLQRRIEAAL